MDRNLVLLNRNIARLPSGTASDAGEADLVLYLEKRERLIAPGTG
jgi:hypothetical protein